MRTSQLQLLGFPTQLAQLCVELGQGLSHVAFCVKTLLIPQKPFGQAGSVLASKSWRPAEEQLPVTGSQLVVSLQFKATSFFESHH